MTDIILSNNKILMDGLKGSSISPISLNFSDLSRLDSCQSIRILLVDSSRHLKDLSARLYRAKFIINLTDSQIDTRQISLKKPFLLSDLLTIIDNCLADEKLFTSLMHGDWIYNELLNILQGPDSQTALTEKESQIIKYLIKNGPQSKEALRKDVWRYDDSLDTNTIESHLSRLKQKLPNGLLKIEDGICAIVQ